MNGAGPLMIIVALNGNPGHVPDVVLFGTVILLLLLTGYVVSIK